MEANRYPHVKSDRMKELDAMIEAGWGSVRQYSIPSNWRDIPGPYAELKDEDDVPEPLGPMRETEVLLTKLSIAGKFPTL